VSYRQEIEKAVHELKEFIVTHEARPQRIECLEDALNTLTYAAQNAARWANRMMLLERRIRAAQNIFDGTTKITSARREEE
jgi:CII-binding regulator of phage lambda lysogenization HflD